jgi:hypothetical protein
MTDKEINLILGKHDLSMVVGKDREQIIAAIRDAVVAERNACLEAVEKSRVIEFVVYPKDYMISRNDVPRCYDFQHARTMEAIKARGNQ